MLADLSGRLRVKDADTFALGGETVRLYGIDAPETDQMCGGAGAPMWSCGAWAAQEVRARYQGQPATCEDLGRDGYGRVLGRCFVAGEDVARAIVRDGLAFAYRRYAMDYDLDEKTAAVQGKGLHGAGVQSPAAFRAAGRRGLAARNLADAPQGCTIKGNISRDGKRIYHLPGQAWDDKTRIAPAKGERWFCSPSQAQAAGWRQARR